jgi:sugar lactone lactonase YvrE
VIRVVEPCGNRLGESAVWQPAEQALYWLDLLDPALFRLAPGQPASRVPLPLEPPLGSMAATDRPGVFVLTHPAGLSLLDARTGALAPFAAPEDGRAGVAYNDGKVDRWGRLWIGTSDLAEAEPRGVLWCVSPDGAAHLADSGFVVSNGPAFSPDGRTLYFSDSVARRILAYDITPDDPRPRSRRVLAAMAPDEGLPDGLTVDADGGLWVAHWDGWRVTRFSPEGERTTMIPLPVPRVTSLAFGGRALDVLYATTAACDLAAPVLAAAPASGHLFAIETGFRGLPERPFGIA